MFEVRCLMAVLGATERRGGIYIKITGSDHGLIDSRNPDYFIDRSATSAFIAYSRRQEQEYGRAM
jgi:hypothetical protein